MYAVANESVEKLGWFAPSTAHEVIQFEQLKTGSEVIAKPTGKNKVEVLILGKATESEHPSFADEPEDVKIRS